MMTKTGWQVNEEVNWDKTSHKADQVNLEINSKDEVMYI